MPIYSVLSTLKTDTTPILSIFQNLKTKTVQKTIMRPRHSRQTTSLNYSARDSGSLPRHENIGLWIAILTNGIHLDTLDFSPWQDLEVDTGCYIWLSLIPDVYSTLRVHSKLWNWNQV